MEGTKEKKDIIEKEFLSYPDIAADTINALLYQGKEVTEAGKLWAGPTETIYQGKENLRNQYEDVCKYKVDQWMKEQKIREEDEITVCELFDQYERKGR